MNPNASFVHLDEELEVNNTLVDNDPSVMDIDLQVSFERIKKCWWKPGR